MEVAVRLLGKVEENICKLLSFFNLVQFEFNLEADET